MECRVEGPDDLCAWISNHLHHLQDPAAFNCVSIVLDTDADPAVSHSVVYVAWSDFGSRYGSEVKLDNMGRMKWHLVPQNPQRFFHASTILHPTVCPVGPKSSRVEMPLVGRRFVEMWREMLRQIHDNDYAANVRCELCGLMLDDGSGGGREERLCTFCLTPLHTKCASHLLRYILERHGHDELVSLSPGDNPKTWLTCDFTDPKCPPRKTVPDWCAICQVWIGVGFAKAAQLKHDSDVKKAEHDKDDLSVADLFGDFDDDAEAPQTLSLTQVFLSQIDCVVQALLLNLVSPAGVIEPEPLEPES